jgi:hypothetical protein
LGNLQSTFIVLNGFEVVQVIEKLVEALGCAGFSFQPERTLKTNADKKF